MGRSSRLLLLPPRSYQGLGARTSWTEKQYEKLLRRVDERQRVLEREVRQRLGEGEGRAGASLPAGWHEFESADGVKYYFNEESGETVWERPQGVFRSESSRLWSVSPSEPLSQVRIQARPDVTGLRQPAGWRTRKF